MSDVGSQSGFYEELHECAELIDSVLVELRQGISGIASKECQELGVLLVGLGARNWIQTPSRTFVILAGLFRESDRQEWASVGTSLIHESPDDGTIARLEELAARLEQEQQTVMARIQGL